MAGTILPLGGR